MASLNVQLVFEMFNKLPRPEYKSRVRNLLHLYNACTYGRTSSNKEMKLKDLLVYGIDMERGLSDEKVKAIFELGVWFENIPYYYNKAFENIFADIDEDEEDDKKRITDFLDEFKTKLDEVNGTRKKIDKPVFEDIYVKTQSKGERIVEKTLNQLVSLRRDVRRVRNAEKRVKKQPPHLADYEVDMSGNFDIFDLDLGGHAWYQKEYTTQPLYDFKINGKQYRGLCEEYGPDGYIITSLVTRGGDNIKLINNLAVVYIEFTEDTTDEDGELVDVQHKLDRVNFITEIDTKYNVHNWDEDERWGNLTYDKLVEQSPDLHESDVSIVTSDEYTDDGNESYNSSDDEKKPKAKKAKKDKKKKSTKKKDKYKKIASYRRRLAYEAAVNEELRRVNEELRRIVTEYKIKYENEGDKTVAKKAKSNPLGPTHVYKALRKLHIYGKLKY